MSGRSGSDPSSRPPKEAIPDHLRLHAPTRHVPEIRVVLVDAASAGSDVEAMRNVLLVTMSRCIAFMLHPWSMNSAANQSSRAGCEGRRPFCPNQKRWHNRLAEVTQPNVIHRHASGQWIFTVRNPTSEGRRRPCWFEDRSTCSLRISGART